MRGMSHVSKSLRIAIGFSLAAALLGGLVSLISAGGIPLWKRYLPIFGALLFFAGLIAAIAMLVTIGLYILAPLDQTARHRRRPTQFTMVDFLSLIFLFQLPMATIRAFVDANGHQYVMGLQIFGWLATSAMWGLSVRTLSRAGIENTRHRGIFLAFVLPAAYFGSVVFTVIVTVSVISLFVREALPRGAAPMMFAIAAALLPAFFLSARFVRKMVAASAGANELSTSGVDYAPVEPQALQPPGAEANVDHP